MPLITHEVVTIATDVQTLLSRISEEDDPFANADSAWQVFRIAREEHLRSLRADLQTVPIEARPIIAATVARLEERDPIDELERHRTTSSYSLSRAAAQALGRYLASPDLSGSDVANENLLRAVAHKDERVRREAASVLKHRNDPAIAKALLDLVLAEYPASSPRQKRRRGIVIGLVRAAIWSPWFLAAFFGYKFGPGVVMASALTGGVVGSLLEKRFLTGRKQLSDEQRGEILSCLMDIEPDRPTAFVDKLAELRTIQFSLSETSEAKRAACRLIERIETSASTIHDLPVVAEPNQTTETDLPLPANG